MVRESWKTTMKRYEENQRKKRIKTLLGAGICFCIVTTVGVIQAQVPKIDKKA